MSAIVIEDQVSIPSWVRSLSTFRRWARSSAFPEHGWFAYLDGQLWVDLSMERLAHNQVKAAMTAVLTLLARSLDLGRFFADRMMLVHRGAGLATEPDGMFAAHEALRAGRVELIKGDDAVEVSGSVDMALEIVSPKSVRKDTVLLRQLYWKAGIREYWLVDPRQVPTRFDIFRHTARGYVATRRQAGWLRSQVFGKSFRLTERKDREGLTEYHLVVK